MESILTTFEHISSLQRTFILAGGMTLLWLLEDAVPLFPLRYRRYRHARVNLFYTLTSLAVNLVLSFLLINAALWAEARGFGVLNVVSLPIGLRIITGLLLLDLVGAYLIHWLEHRFRWLWKFHLIHHTDQHIDVTSGLRHHPGESVFRAIFTLLAIVVSGSSLGLIFLYQSISAFFAQFTHANIRMPVQVDRLLSWVIVTPLMHKVHHHYKQPLTDSNYGNIFAIWDRLFGTFRKVDDTGALTYGIDSHMEPDQCESTFSLMMIPFRRYQAPDGSKFSSEDDDV